jgi:hypothetical protein
VLHKRRVCGIFSLRPFLAPTQGKRPTSPGASKPGLFFYGERLARQVDKPTPGTIITRINNEGSIKLDPPGIEIAMTDVYAA